MHRSIIEANSRERTRLRHLVAGLTDDQLALAMGDDWTIAIALAHLAFWDQRSLTLIRKWKHTGVVQPSPIDIDVTNETLLSLWRQLRPRAAADLAVASAEAVDSEVAATSGEMIAQIERIEGRSRIDRSIHRKMHLDQIEKRLEGRDAG